MKKQVLSQIRDLRFHLNLNPSMKRIYTLAALLLIFISAFCAAPTITSFSPASGPVGTLVTITGTNLTAPTAFTIDGVTAIVVSNTGTSLVGFVMPGAVTGAVSITTAGGTATGAANFTVTATPYPSTQQAKVSDSSDHGADQGAAVAISADGNTAVFGGIGIRGSIWVYTRSGTVWTQQGPALFGTGGVTPSYQGISVAISAVGNTIIEGGYEDNTYIGAAWVFTRTGGVWTQQGAKLVPTGYTGQPEFGYAVSISADGNTALIGGYEDNNFVGAAWIFTRTAGVWTQQGNKLVGSLYVGSAMGDWEWRCRQMAIQP